MTDHSTAWQFHITEEHYNPETLEAGWEHLIPATCNTKWKQTRHTGEPRTRSECYFRQSVGRGLRGKTFRRQPWQVWSDLNRK